MVTTLTQDDWLAQGFRTLAAEGYGALKAERLAKALNVSRGSFYWHFRDLAGFHAALIDAWCQRAARQVIEEVEHLASGGDRLKALMRRSMAADNQVERAVRSWATHDPDVASRLQAVDDERLGYLLDLLGAAGLSPRQARARAAFIRWAYFGRMMQSGGPVDSVAPDDLDAIAELLQSA